MRTQIIIIIVFSFFSCNQLKEKEINKTNNIITINIDNESQFIDYKLKLTKKIQLETTKESLIGQAGKIIYRHNKIFIQDLKTHSLFVFDTDGKFIQQIGRRGRGPGEHPELRDFSISNDDLIYLLTYNRILTYNFDGKYITTINIKHDDKILLNPLKFATLNGNDFFLWQGTFGYKHDIDRMPYLMYKMSSNGDLLNGYFATSRITMGNHTQFSPCYDGININPPFGEYSIYKIDNNDLFENVKIDFGKNTLMSDQLEKGFSDRVAKQEYELRNSNYCVGIDNFLETEDYYYFTFIYEGKLKQILYSKKTKDYTIGKLTPFTKMLCTKDKYFIAAVEPYFLEYISTQTISNEEIYRSLKALKVEIEANPILLQFEISDF